MLMQRNGNAGLHTALVLLRTDPLSHTLWIISHAKAVKFHGLRLSCV